MWLTRRRRVIDRATPGLTELLMPTLSPMLHVVVDVGGRAETSGLLLLRPLLEDAYG